MNFAILSSIRLGLLDLFFPELCLYCQRHLSKDEKTLCLHCILKLPKTNFHLQPGNNSFKIFIGRIPIEQATSFVYFTKDGMMQDLLHRFKYEGKQAIGKLCGQLLAGDLSSSHWMKDIDIVIPIPLHKKKERSRGFNQADVFAQSLGKHCNIEVMAHAITRTKFTVSQTTKSRQSRLDNVAGVFKIKNSHPLKNKHILLVDDVLTTGATIESCALELLKTEGIKISIATIALARD